MQKVALEMWFTLDKSCELVSLHIYQCLLVIIFIVLLLFNCLWRVVYEILTLFTSVYSVFLDKLKAFTKSVCGNY